MSFFRANLIGLKADRDKKEIGTSIRAVLSDHGGIGQPAYRNPACIMPGCTGEGH
jgi:hypothetical protein